MQRHRRRTPGKNKRGIIDDWETVSELKGLIEARLKHQQLKAELEFLKLEQKLNQHIKRFQNRRLDQLEHDFKPEKDTSRDDQ